MPLRQLRTTLLTPWLALGLWLSAWAGPGDYTREAGLRIASPCVSAQVLRLANGSYRAYCSAGGRIASAVSVDGLTWTDEPGTRLFGAINPAVIPLKDGNWRMIYGIQRQNPIGETQYSAFSRDGLTFTPEPGVRLEPTPEENGFASVADIVRLPDGALRMYYTALQSIGNGGVQSAIRSAWSTDEGLTWTRDAGWRLGPGTFGPAGVMDPAVVRLADGSFRMYVTYQGLQYPPPGAAHQIFSATSRDSVNFTPDDGVRLTAGAVPLEAAGIVDPFPVLLPDGTVRLYYSTKCSDAALAAGGCFSQLLSAVSAPTVNVTGIVEGSLERQSVTVAVNPAPSAACARQEVWIVAFVPQFNVWFFYGSQGWTGAAVPWGSVSAAAQVPILSGVDMRPIAGTQVFVGYGCDVGDMVNAGRYGRVYVAQ